MILNTGWLSDVPYLETADTVIVKTAVRNAIHDSIKNMKVSDGLEIMRQRKSGNFGLTVAIGNGKEAIAITITIHT
jgi:hypothetical protein